TARAGPFSVLRKREVLCDLVWAQTGPGIYIFCAHSCIDEKSPEEPEKFVRMEIGRTATVRALPSGQGCAVEQISLFDLKGSVPKAISDRVAVPNAINTPVNMITYFACARRADEYSDQDAKELGMLVAHKLRPHRGNEEVLRQEIKKIILTTGILRGPLVGWLEEFLFHVVQNKVTKPQSDQLANAFEFTADNAEKAGKSLAALLLSNIVAVSAVDELFHSFPAFLELANKPRYSWWRPFVEALAQEVLASSRFGLKARVYSGAVLSVADSLSDAYITRSFFLTGNRQYGKFMVATMGLNVGLQCVTVFFNNMGVEGEGKLTFMAKELLSVIFFLKPGVDAHRVVVGTERKKGQIFTCFNELVVCKYIEIFAEAIPGLILQAYSILALDEVSRWAVFSCVLSAVTTSMVTTATFYDVSLLLASTMDLTMPRGGGGPPLSSSPRPLTPLIMKYDVNPENRKSDPITYGLISNTGRTSAFLAMLFMSSAQVLSKGLSTALLALTSLPSLGIYLLADMALFIGYKLWMGDFIYHEFSFDDNDKNLLVVLLSLIMRIGAKLNVDFTGAMLFRIPMHAGGLCYSFSMLSSMIAVVVSAYMYTQDERFTVLQPSTVWAAVVSLLLAWIISLLVFITCVAAPGYRSSFWSTLTCRETIITRFRTQTDVKDKFDVFTCHRSKWRSIEGEVKDFVKEEWGALMRDKPAWFTEALRAQVPAAFIPAADPASRGSQRRLALVSTQDSKG
ncbi:hypothetical protein TeGR_g2870, partial [Tetraparma gracilis]